MYNNRNSGKEVAEIITKVMKEFEKERLIFGGDFNIRIGNLGGDEGEGGVERKSKDKMISNGGRKFIDSMIENGLNVLNEFKVEERVDSDHMPVCMKMEETEEEEERDGRRKMKLKKQEKKIIEKKRICWDPEAIEKYKAKTEEIGWTEEQERISLDRKWNKLKNLVQEAMTKKVYKIKKRKIGHKDWWDKSCTMRKRELRTESEVWNFINKKRKRREWKEANINLEAWRRHFMKLLGGEEKKREEEEEGTDEVVRENRGEDEEQPEELEQREEPREEPIEEEIIKAVRKAKMKKAAGIDGIPMEGWRYGGEAVKKGLTKIIEEVWKTYKIYAEIIREKLEKEVEEKDLLPENQAGFRKGKSTLDNIYVLNHVVQREKEKEGGERKVYALFIDLKAAFDNVDREKLWKILEKKGVSGLIKRMKNIYAETEVVVRTEKGLTKSFMVNKGVRQGCVLSPTLFNLYIADLEEELRDRNIRGVTIGKHRIWSLAYADDIVLLAKNATALQDMMDTMKRFLKARRLELCTEKTKLIVFNSAGTKNVDRILWNDKVIEKVKSFKYLGFIFNRKGSYADHIKEIGRKGRIAANKVWGLGERICKNDFRRRWMLFRYLVISVMSYGVELWGWEEKKELEKIMLDYVRWVFRLDFCTPRYLLRRELDLGKLKIKWGTRAVRYDMRVRDFEENSLVKKCWWEKRDLKRKDLYSKEKERYYNSKGWSVEAIEESYKEGKDVESMMIERERDMQKQMEEGKIREARYNKRYKEWSIDIGKPRYLQKKYIDDIKIGDQVRALMRVRCGNMEENNKYWREEDERRCIFCEIGKDELEHYVDECRCTKEWFISLGADKKERLDRIGDDDLEKNKGEILEKLWKEKEKRKRELERRNQEIRGKSSQDLE
ncbi:uncharacterized protein LOC109861916 [Pseudomyrmex gracilis]|uniref:uncharacterized protein LOC109861916 n=1 Tax=Pseudomyrmex gracilis TaxID=219809 RepID=UPI000995D6CC|nr:uncharacterized protein LOC109861916 [Pseudomyrmex gracilis]